MQMSLLRNGRILILSVCLSAVAISFAANTAVAQETVQTASQANRDLTYALVDGAVKIGDLDQAQRILSRQLETDSDDHVGWALQADIYLKQQNYAQAESAFRRAASSSELRGPTKSNEEVRAQYLYQAANARVLEGDLVQVQQLLQEVVHAAPSIQGLGAQVERIKSVLKAGQPLPPLKVTDGDDADDAKKIRYLFGLRSGYDSNVLLLPDDTTGVSPGSAFVSPSVVIDGALPISVLDIKGRSVSNFTAYTAEPSRKFNTIFQSLNAEWSPRLIRTETFSPTVGSRADLSFVNSDGMDFFSWTGTAYLNAVYTLDEVSSVLAELPLGYQRFPGVVVLDGVDRRDGWLLSPTAVYRRRIGEWSLSGGANYQEAWTMGQNFKSRTIGTTLGASRPLLFEIMGRLGLGYNRVNYRQSLTNRRDTRVDVSMGLTRIMPFSKRMTVNLDYIYSSNDSSLTTATYKRHSVFLQATYAL